MIIMKRNSTDATDSSPSKRKKACSMKDKKLSSPVNYSDNFVKRNKTVAVKTVRVSSRNNWLNPQSLEVPKKNSPTPNAALDLSLISLKKEVDGKMLNAAQGTAVSGEVAPDAPPDPPAVPLVAEEATAPLSADKKRQMEVFSS